MALMTKGRVVQDKITCTTGMVVPVGTVSEGTLRAEDLLSAALHTYEAVNPAGFVILAVERADVLKGFVKTRTSQVMLGTPFDFTDHQIGGIIELCCDVIDGINKALPEGWEYGSHSGDPACIGIWQTEENE